MLSALGVKPVPSPSRKDAPSPAGDALRAGFFVGVLAETALALGIPSCPGDAVRHDYALR
jgi:hypothetical protein